MKCTLYKTVPEVTSLSSFNMTLFPEENFTLSCDYSGIPLPNVQWRKDNNVNLNETIQTFLIIPTNTTTAIAVNSDRGSNGGFYTCEALNVAGISSLNFTVQCKLI